MPQLAIYLDEELARRLARAARAAKLSRSGFVSAALREKLDERLPGSFFEALGSWQDTRTSGEILADIRTASGRDEREPLR
jgi:predicted transcriptional regulator